MGYSYKKRVKNKMRESVNFEKEGILYNCSVTVALFNGTVI